MGSMARSGFDDFSDDVFRLLVASGNTVGWGTVYRVLMQFVEAGVLQRLVFEGDKAYFELDEGQHDEGSSRFSPEAGINQLLGCAKESIRRHPRCGGFLKSSRSAPSNQSKASP